MLRTVLRYRRTWLILLGLSLSVVVLIRCTEKPGKQARPNNSTAFDSYAGSAKCASCHQDIYEKHLLTAHFLTSSLAAEQTIKGSFAEGKNTFIFNSQDMVQMEKRDSGFYQVEYIQGAERKARRFDISVGSGTRGQTYLYWWKDTLFQMPITYFTATQSWSNSPGYSNRAMFGRPVTSRCLECHSTFAQVTSPADAKVEEFDKSRMILAVDCERCHGPAAKHVEYQTKHPEDKVGQFVIDPKGFTRQQSLDMCALCHGGRLTKTKPSFSFQAGDKLDDYFEPRVLTPNPADIDVHGNQYGLLAASKCFSMSELSCLSCHNPHENEKGKLALYSQRCMTCHNPTQGHECRLLPKEGAVITQNCIDCHMPEQRSGAIQVLLQGELTPTPATMRTHYISIYPDETKKILDALHKKNK